MTELDVLLITALKEEHDAARAAALPAAGTGVGVATWEERDAGSATPYLLGRYVGLGGRNLTVALARPTRMGATATSPVVASLAERLKPRCLAMCGVCAGNPGDVALGDVIIAEMVYAYDEGKQKQESFEGDHRQVPMADAWVRAAQDLLPDGLPTFGPASTEESKNWVLERLHAREDPRKHPARVRYFSERTWSKRIRELEVDGLVRRDGATLILTDRGRTHVENILFNDPDGPEKLPFQIKVGPIASGNVVVKDGITWDNLKKWGVRSVLGLEMEAATIGSVAHRLGVPRWVVAKGVMDHANPRKDDRYKQFAARASAEVLFKFLLAQAAIPADVAGVRNGLATGAQPVSAPLAEKSAARATIASDATALLAREVGPAIVERSTTDEDDPTVAREVLAILRGRFSVGEMEMFIRQTFPDIPGGLSGIVAPVHDFRYQTLKVLDYFKDRRLLCRLRDGLFAWLEPTAGGDR
jgi:nucleoside phosphorylase